jgi:hypothetical protein
VDEGNVRGARAFFETRLRKASFVRQPRIFDRDNVAEPWPFIAPGPRSHRQFRQRDAIRQRGSTSIPFHCRSRFTLVDGTTPHIAVPDLVRRVCRSSSPSPAKKPGGPVCNSRPKPFSSTIRETCPKSDDACA